MNGTGRFAGLLAALLFLVIGSGQMVLAWRLPGGVGLSVAEPGPGLFPLLVGGLLCAAAAAYLIQVLSLPRSPATGEGAAPWKIVALVGSLAAYIVLLPRLGFPVAAFLLVLATLSIYGMPGLWRRVAVAALITLAAYLAFTLALKVSFPAASWLQ